MIVAMRMLLPENERQYIRNGLHCLGLHSLSEYHDSVYWMAKKVAYNKKHPKICIRCKSSNDITLHHKTYKHLGRESHDDLEYLCRDCHENTHKKLTRNIIQKRKDAFSCNYKPTITKIQYKVISKIKRTQERFSMKIRKKVAMACIQYNFRQEYLQQEQEQIAITERLLSSIDLGHLLPSSQVIVSKGQTHFALKK